MAITIDEIYQKSKAAIADIKGGPDGKTKPSEFVVTDALKYKDSIYGFQEPKAAKPTYVLVSIDESEIQRRVAEGKSRNDALFECLSEISNKEGGLPVIAKIENTSNPASSYVMLGDKKKTVFKKDEATQEDVKSVVIEKGTTNFSALKAFTAMSFPPVGESATFTDKPPQAVVEKIKQSGAHSIEPDLVAAQTEQVAKDIILRAQKNTAQSPPVRAKNKSAGESELAYEAKVLKDAADVEKGGLAECMGFAEIAYAKLKEALPGVRLQLVDNGLHKMILIGYEGNDNPINPENIDSSKCYIADVWALSMGYEEVFIPGKGMDQCQGIYRIDNYPLRSRFFSDQLNVNLDSDVVKKELAMGVEPAIEMSPEPEPVKRALSVTALMSAKMAEGDKQKAMENLEASIKTQPKPVAVEAPKIETPAEPPKPQGFTLTSGTAEPNKIAVNFIVDKKSGTLDAIEFEFIGAKGPEKITMSSQEFMKAMGMRLSEYKPIREAIINANGNEERLAALKGVSEKVVGAVAQKSPEAGVTPQKTTDVVANVEADVRTRIPR